MYRQTVAMPQPEQSQMCEQPRKYAQRVLQALKIPVYDPAMPLSNGCGSPRRSSQWNGSLNRSELEVQFLEAPEQKGAVPFEPTSACRTVLGL